MTPDLFNAVEAERRREEGMARAAAARPELLAVAQRHAMRIASLTGSVTADEVAEAMAVEGFDYARLGNAAGSVFRELEWTGRVEKSKRPSTHGRIIRVWKTKQP